jgi:N-methylhydantoinase A
MRVGVEVGGTFTDLVAFDGDRIVVTKVPSTPASPDIGAYNAIEAAGLDFKGIEDLAHGSTVATNAVLERKGARLAFLVTKGFRDLLGLQRHDRRQIYDLFYKKPQPVVARRDTFEIGERMLADGTAALALDEVALQGELIAKLKAGNYQAVAICLLNAYVNPAHERRVAELVERALPGCFVTCSHDVSRVFREYERASTTTLSAFVQPVINRYLGSFEERLKSKGFHGRFSVMQSNGGRLPAAAMRKSAITALFSGPAAGVVGAIRQGARSKLANLITFDMGGTSTDVCLAENGRPSLANETEVDGLPIQTPVLDIVTVGGGGGSIIWIDDGGMLRVGPRSAGADPGPACYGRGGKEATITDAQVVLGAVRPAAFLGGRMKIDPEAARAVLAPLATHFGLTVEGMAESAIKLVNANIVRAIQLVSTERGKDPRDFVLMPFGGAGPLHAAHIAAELGVQRICVPPNPGVISAYGLIVSDFTKYAAITQQMPIDDGPTAGLALFRRLEKELTAEFRSMGFSGKLDYTYTAEMRFVGQAFEVAVDFTEAELASMSREKLLKAFEEAHYRVYFHGIGASQKVEIVSLRVGASAPVEDMRALTTPGGGESRIETHRLYDAGAWIDCRHVPAEAIAEGESLAGPVIVSGATATTYIPSGWSAMRDAADNLIMSRS